MGFLVFRDLKLETTNDNKFNKLGFLKKVSLERKQISEDTFFQVEIGVA